LEEDAPKKYYLSATACLGILRRARRREKELHFLLHEALIYMIFKEDENGQKGIADTIEILRKMWSEIGEEDLKEWIQRTFVLVQSEEILLPEMCESKNTNEYTNECILVEGDSTKNDAEEELCNMRCNGEVGDTPQRRKPNEQLAQELDLLMQKLSFEDAQNEVIMYCLRIACEGETSVFETLPTVSEGEIIGVHDRDGEECITLEPGIASREGGHIYEGVSGTLRANAGDNQMSVAYSIENHPADSRVTIDESGKVQTLTSRMGTGGGNVPMVMECYRKSARAKSKDDATTWVEADKSNTLNTFDIGETRCNELVVMETTSANKSFIDVEMEVAVRKYEVDCKKLSECLRKHKVELRLSNKHIADELDVPLTEVEHWFRTDKYFAIPSPEVWLDLKQMLGIKTDEFDKSIMEFEFKGANYDMRNRIYVGNTSPTLTRECGNNLHLLPVGVDCYNQSLTGGKTMTLTNCATDPHHIPCVVMDRSAYNQGINAKFDIGIDEDGVAFSCIAKGPGAVAYIDTSHADDVVRMDDVVAPLQARDYKGGKLIAMATQQGGAEIRTDDKCPTLTAAAGMSGNNQPVICLQGNGIDRADTAGCNGKGWKEGTSYTLNTIDRPAVCYSKPHYIVRRLTPLECERLQGFPDGWTDIGEYIDSNGKKKQSSDSARYKALGNSISIPNWKWVLKRLCSHYERDATLASLFDGIGGFPYIWEQLNGKGTAVWASEIEEFPMAVTKARIE
jgi:hypothetical protein